MTTCEPFEKYPRSVLGKQFGFSAFSRNLSRWDGLHYLDRLPVAEIKIDPSFVQRAPGEARARHLINAMVEAAAAFSCRVVAEGVEDEAQERTLSAWPELLLQGWLRSVRHWRRNSLLSRLQKQLRSPAADAQGSTLKAMCRYRKISRRRRRFPRPTRA